ncbi:MAG: hypothetical protein PHU56_00320 [Candidatus Pacebacteria bacterium]|nr:hypothetical protein [Candidatus Paceibacterota bacterium]
MKTLNFFFLFFVFSLFISISSSSANLGRLTTLVRPEFPEVIEQFWEFDEVVDATLVRHDMPDIKAGMTYEVKNHRLCPDNVDIGILYHVHISIGPEPGTFMLRGRIGPKNHDVWKDLGDADVNVDGTVDEIDLLTVMVNKKINIYGPGDCNRDGVVDETDLKIVYASFEGRPFSVSPSPKKMATTWGAIKGRP